MFHVIKQALNSFGDTFALILHHLSTTERRCLEAIKMIPRLGASERLMNLMNLCPGRLTCNPKMEVWKILFRGSTLSFTGVYFTHQRDLPPLAVYLTNHPCYA